MRIMTYNIHGWRTMDGESNLAAVGDAILASGADVVGLNEVHYPRVVVGDARPALQALAARLEMQFVFGPCLRWPAEDDMLPNAYGNALLSRWPIIASAAHHLTPKEEDQQGLLVAREQRGLLEGRILLPDGRTFTAYVTHLDHTDEAARAVQLRVARGWGATATGRTPSWATSTRSARGTWRAARSPPMLYAPIPRATICWAARRGCR
jgi:endonuclease/exonuclease/phosphatase family metal-dependent hydrolase